MVTRIKSRWNRLLQCYNVYTEWSIFYEIYGTNKSLVCDCALHYNQMLDKMLLYIFDSAAVVAQYQPTQVGSMWPDRLGHFLFCIK